MKVEVYKVIHKNTQSAMIRTQLRDEWHKKNPNEAAHCFPQPTNYEIDAIRIDHPLKTFLYSGDLLSWQNQGCSEELEAVGIVMDFNGWIHVVPAESIKVKRNTPEAATNERRN